MNKERIISSFISRTFKTLETYLAVDILFLIIIYLIFGRNFFIEFLLLENFFTNFHKKFAEGLAVKRENEGQIFLAECSCNKFLNVRNNKSIKYRLREIRLFSTVFRKDNFFRFLFQQMWLSTFVPKIATKYYFLSRKYKLLETL